MRCVTPIRVALLGLGLSLAGSTAVYAQSPGDTCQTCQQKHSWFHKHTVRGPRLCAKCLEAQRQANGGVLVPPAMPLPGTPGCAGCQARVAAVGMGMPNVMMAGNMGPGFAISGEPTPVGVVQASYRPGGGATAPGYAAVGPMVPSDPRAWSSATGGTALAQPRHNKPHVVLHLLGLRDPDSPWAEWQEKARQSHAAIAYGPQHSQVSELPASVVYGR